MLASLDKQGIPETPGKSTEPFRIGMVETVTAQGCRISWGNGSNDEKSYLRLASYAPAVGDKILAVRHKGSYYILGKFAR